MEIICINHSVKKKTKTKNKKNPNPRQYYKLVKRFLFLWRSYFVGRVGNSEFLISALKTPLLEGGVNDLYFSSSALNL